MVKKIVQLLFFLGLGLTILYFLYQNQNQNWIANCANKGVELDECGTLFQKIKVDFSRVNLYWILSVLAVYVVSNVSRSIRWLLLLKPIEFKPNFLNAFFSIMLGYFANLGFPRIGEIVRAGSYAKYQSLGPQKVLGTIVTDRILDVVSLILVIGFAFFLEYQKIIEFIFHFYDESSSASRDITPLLIGLVIFIGTVIGLGVYLIKTKSNWFFQNKFVEKVKNVVHGFIQGITSIRHIEKPYLLLFHSINIWFMYFLMTYLAFFAFEPTSHLTPKAGLLIFVIGAMGIVIPTPGGLGSYNVLVTSGLVSLYEIASSDAFSFSIILFFAVNVGVNVVLGLVSLIALPLLNRERKMKVKA